MNEINVILAEHPGLGRVRLCECNSIHLSIGPVSLSLAPEAFEQAAMMIQRALAELKEISGTASPDTNSLHRGLAPQSRLTH